VRILLNKNQIAEKVSELGAQVSRDYAGKNPLLVGCLKGCLVFMADLIRAMAVPHTIDFVRLATYGSEKTTSGHIQAEWLEIDVSGRHVVIIEDIVDSGLTLEYLMAALEKQAPLSMKVCALLVKEVTNQAAVTIDYTGFTIPDQFVVGYGLDWGEGLRHLARVAVVGA